MQRTEITKRWNKDTLILTIRCYDFAVMDLTKDIIKENILRSKSKDVVMTMTNPMREITKINRKEEFKEKFKLVKKKEEKKEEEKKE